MALSRRFARFIRNFSSSGMRAPLVLRQRHPADVPVHVIEGSAQVGSFDVPSIPEAADFNISAFTCRILLSFRRLGQVAARRAESNSVERSAFDRPDGVVLMPSAGG